MITRAHSNWFPTVDSRSVDTSSTGPTYSGAWTVRFWLHHLGPRYRGSIVDEVYSIHRRLLVLTYLIAIVCRKDPFDLSCCRIWLSGVEKHLVSDFKLFVQIAQIIDAIIR